MRKMPPRYGAINAIRFALVTCLITCAVESRSVAGEAAFPAPVLVSRIATDGDFVTLPVRVDGQQLLFIVDTGSPTTTFDASFRARLAPAGEAEKQKAIPYKDAPELYTPPAMTVMGSERGAIAFPRDLAVVCVDLSKFQQASDLLVQGVIGMDFLKAYALHLDLAQGEISLYEDADFLARSGSDARIGMSVVRGYPCIQLTSADIVFWAVVDTGALVSLSLDRKSYEYLLSKWYIGETTFEILSGTERKIVATNEGWLRELKVGPFSHSRISVDEDDPVSLLGLYYWRRYHCVFDFPGKTIYLKRSRFFDVRDDTDHAGIYVEPAEGAAGARRVEYVALASAADRAGVRVDDYLVSVDGRKIGADSQHSIYRRLSFRHDRPCELVLSRQGSEIRITLPASGFDAAVRD